MSDDLGDRDALAAGDFSAWLTGMRAAIAGERDAEVPCGSCTACCTASQFVAIGPDEAETLAHIPAELVFPAPLSPPGHVVLGYDERGHCPMLVDGRCSIYEHRPRTCRTYDCRIFPAAGLAPDDGANANGPKAALARQAVRWRFAYPTEVDRAAHAAVRRRAAHLGAHPEEVPGRAGADPTRLAVLAVETSDRCSDATGASDD